MPAATKTAAPSFNVVLRRLSERAARALHQEGLDENVDVAVEHPVHISDLLFRSVVLHELVRVQHIAPDLAAEGDLLLGPADLLQLGLLLLELQVVEPRLQY